MYSVKVELKLNNREKTLMNQHIGFSRFCYNYALSIYKELDHKKYKGSSSKKIALIRKIFTNVTKKNPVFAWVEGGDSLNNKLIGCVQELTVNEGCPPSPGTLKVSSRVYQNATQRCWVSSV